MNTINDGAVNVNGNLQLMEGHSTGSVVVQNLDTKEIFKVVQTDDKGWFELSGLPPKPNLKFFGFSGQQISIEDAPNAIKKLQQISYIAILNEQSNLNLAVYLNAASTLIAVHLETSRSLNYNQAANSVKSYLFCNTFLVLAPGYSPELIAYLAPQSVFDNRIFVAKALPHGGILPYVYSLVNNELTSTETEFPYAYAHHDKTFKKASETSSNSNPTVPTSADWGIYDPNWGPIIQLQTDGLANRMTDLANITDGIAALANGPLSSDVNTNASSSLTLGDIGKWAGGQMGGALVSYISGFGISMLSDWIFDPSNPQTAIQNALVQIKGQLKSVISDQLIEISILNKILKATEKNTVQIIVSSLQNPVSVIQSCYQTIHDLSKTTTGYSHHHLQKVLCDPILSPTTGVMEALIDINNGVLASVGTSLPAALMPYLLTNHSLLSNENFYAATQKIFIYYALMLTQGVMVLLQVHNYNSNSSVNDPSTTLTFNPNIQSLYNTWLIGGGSSSNPSNIQQQVTLFQSTYSDYYSSFQPYISATLPADMAVGFLPQISNQPYPLFYNNAAGIIILGLVSTWFSNWTSGSNVLEINNVDPSQIPLPGNMTWRYPSSAEFANLLLNMPPNYADKQFKYLEQQGISFLGGSSADSLFGLWTSDTGFGFANRPNNNQDGLLNWEPTTLPTDYQYNKVANDWWSVSDPIFGNGLWHLQLGGATMGMAYCNNPQNAASALGTAPNSSYNLNQLNQQQNNTLASWMENVFFQVVYGFIVADATAPTT